MKKNQLILKRTFKIFTGGSVIKRIINEEGLLSMSIDSSNQNEMSSIVDMSKNNQAIKNKFFQSEIKRSQRFT